MAQPSDARDSVGLAVAVGVLVGAVSAVPLVLGAAVGDFVGFGFFDFDDLGWGEVDRST